MTANKLKRSSSGARPFYPEFKELADLIDRTLDSGIPGEPRITAAEWVRKFGHGAIDYTGFNNLQRQVRNPTIEALVTIGYLMKKSGAKVEVYDFLLAAADGLWTKIAERFKTDEVPDRSGMAKPQEVVMGYPDDYLSTIYQEMSWDDRLKAMPSLMKAIGRDASFFAMENDLDVIRELVREATNSRNTLGSWVGYADVPYDWVKNILDSRWEDVWAQSNMNLLMKLSSKVRDLDGNLGMAEFFAPLLPKDQRRDYIREVRKGR